jgi:hypothetical protein
MELRKYFSNNFFFKLRKKFGYFPKIKYKKKCNKITVFPEKTPQFKKNQNHYCYVITPFKEIDQTINNVIAWY